MIIVFSFFLLVHPLNFLSDSSTAVNLEDESLEEEEEEEDICTIPILDREEEDSS